ncbi:hypothetical protein JZU51_02405, partial [bacterium]|nr:hypothetical protein [bacterium]
MFQDEARFGRPKPIRPLCYAMVTQEYTYAYAAVSVADGTLDSLILPHVNGDCMQLFLKEVAARHPTKPARRAVRSHKPETSRAHRYA